MKILERNMQFGKFSVLVELNDGNGMRLQFETSPSDAEALVKAQEIYDRQITEQAYNVIETVQFNILNHIELLKDFVQKIKATPTVTLTQYNTWLATKQWWEASIIRYFVFILATKLAEKNGLTLTNLTETTVLQKLRDWIVVTDLKTIGKVIGYGTSND
jgi:hypothetical protein